MAWTKETSEAAAGDGAAIATSGLRRIPGVLISRAARGWALGAMLALVWEPNPVGAQPYTAPTITADRDTSVTDDTTDATYDNYNNGGDTEIIVGTSGPNDPNIHHYGLVHFTITGVPANATVTSASVQMYVTAVPGTSPTTGFGLQFRRINSGATWVEGANSPGVGHAGSACTDGATWNESDCDNNINWGGGGAAVFTTAYSTTVSATYSNADAVGTITWGSTAGLVADVNAWRSGTPNNGWAIVSTSTGSRSLRFLASRAWATANQRPILTLQYQCDSGYQSLDGGATCSTINQCTDETDDCDTEAVCTELVGATGPGGRGWSCACWTGFSGDGYTTMGGTGCANIDECTANLCDGADPCDEATVCTDEIPSFNGDNRWSCSSCGTGCAADNTVLSPQCQVDNPCLANTDDCVAAAACIACSPSDSGDGCSASEDTNGFRCDCNPGYVGDGRSSGTSCTNCNECLGLCPGEPTPNCNGVGVCQDRSPTDYYDCICNSGYENPPGDDNSCQNIDDCASNPCSGDGDQDPAGSCTDAVLGYTCDCPTAGFDESDDCRDTNECALNTDTCDDVPDACTNSLGSYSCACPSGYSGDGSGSSGCLDIDECASAETSGCDPNATCTNAPGSYSCACNEGFEDGTSTPGQVCINIDECTEETHDCSPFATCEDSDGTFICVCIDGYEGSGVDCRDTDECEAANGGCANTEICINQVGADPICECKPGFARAAEGDPCTAACGNGVRGFGEECDDGNAVADDGCDDACEVESGWACFEDADNRSTCRNTCGNELIDEGEECDEGDDNSDTEVDGCRTTCVEAYCGDGIIDTGETCDDEDENSDEAPDACRTTCVPAFCGDGATDSDEVCDPGGGEPLDESRCDGVCPPRAVDGGVGADGGTRMLDGGCATGGTSSGLGFVLGACFLWVLRRRRSASLRRHG